MKEEQEATPIAYKFATFGQMVGVCPATVRRWAKQGHIRVVVIGGTQLVPASEVERLLSDAA